MPAALPAPIPTWTRHIAAEADALFRRLGLLAHLLVVVLFGVVVPWSKGVDFLDPVAAGAYTCLGTLFAGPAASAPLERSAALARVFVATLYGEAMAALLLLTGGVTVFATASLFLLPDLFDLAATALFGLAMTLATASLAVWVNLRFSPGASRMSMRLVFLGLLVAFFFYSRWLPDVALLGAAISFAVACLFLFLLWRMSNQPQT